MDSIGAAIAMNVPVGFSFSPMVQVPPPPPPPDCDEIGQVSKANASAFYRTRIHDTRLMLGEKRCLVANFNGAISAARTIASVKWRTFFGYVVVMSSARVQSDKRSAAVDITANWIGDASIRCEATMDNGEVYIAPFRVSVSGDPIYLPVQTTIGPLELTATASA